MPQPRTRDEEYAVLLIMEQRKTNELLQSMLTVLTPAPAPAPAPVVVEKAVMTDKIPDAVITEIRLGKPTPKSRG